MKELLSWYAAEARQLPWRSVPWSPDSHPQMPMTQVSEPQGTWHSPDDLTRPLKPDPYAIWVSEIMLQQTRVETVIPYYERWMDRFPTINVLADSSLKDVLHSWEGLGYYSRARNLHRASQIVRDQYGGKIPSTLKELRQLPGIGRYTAGAIASIAFGLDEPALDGNIRRVLSRYFNVQEPVRSTTGERKLWQLATENLPPGQASEYNQALMDLGATVCTPRAPECPRCPLKPGCQAYRLGIQEQLPVQAKKTPIPHHTVTAAVISRDNQVLIAQRPLKGLLGGMWEFPGGKLKPGERLRECLHREICEELDVNIHILKKLGVFQHAYTHFKVTLHAYKCHLEKGMEPRPLEAIDLQWVHLDHLADYPMGKVDRMISEKMLTATRLAPSQFPIREDHVPH